MHFLRSLAFQIMFYLNVFFWMVLWLPSLLMRRHGALELGRQWGRTSLFLLDKLCGLKVEFRGLEHLEAGPVIVAAKHQSTWDTFVLPLLFPDFSFILKRELVYLPFFGWYLIAAEQIGIDRAKGGKLLPQLVEKTKRIFAQNRQLFIFPEGTRRLAGAPPDYKYGVAHLYHETGARVLPVALNSGVFWGRHKLLIHPGVAVIEFLPVIEPGLPPREFLNLLSERIETACDRLIDEAVARDPSLAAVIEANKRQAAASPKRKRSASDK